MRKSQFVLAVLIATGAHADALTDVRATLSHLIAATPVRGTFEVSTSDRSSEEDQPFTGKAGVSFEAAETGLRLIYPKALLDQATQEARAEAVDGNRQTPVRTGIGRVRPLALAEMLDAAAALTTELHTAQLLQSKPGVYRGKAARVVTFKLSPPVSKGTAKHLKKLDATLTLYLADDGVPIAADRAVLIKASFLLMSFESDQKQSWIYTRKGDRLVATQYDESQKSDGFGQHQSSTVTETIRLE
jgi:hypothetical protein